MMAQAHSLRSVIVASIASAIAFAILISLGVWQLNRLAWKESLIATLHERLSAAPVDLPPPGGWSDLTPDNSEFRRVRLRVAFDKNIRPAWYFTGGSALRADVKAPGYFVFWPARLPGGNAVVINRGYVPDRNGPVPAEDEEIVGYIRWPETSNWFVSDHDAAGDVWFVRNPGAMAPLRQWGEVAPFYIDMESPVPASGLPRPGALTVNLRNSHLGYAWTWFGLAGTLAGVYIFWLWFGRRKTVNAVPKPSL